MGRYCLAGRRGTEQPDSPEAQRRLKSVTDWIKGLPKHHSSVCFPSFPSLPYNSEQVKGDEVIFGMKNIALAQKYCWLRDFSQQSLFEKQCIYLCVWTIHFMKNWWYLAYCLNEQWYVEEYTKINPLLFFDKKRFYEMTIFLEMHIYMEYVFILHPRIYYHDYLLNLICHLTSSNSGEFTNCVKYWTKNVHLETNRGIKMAGWQNYLETMENNGKQSIQYKLCKCHWNFVSIYPYIYLEISLTSIDPTSDSVYFQCFPHTHLLSHPPTCNMPHISLNL